MAKWIRMPMSGQYVAMGEQMTAHVTRGALGWDWRVADVVGRTLFSGTSPTVAAAKSKCEKRFSAKNDNEEA